MMISTKGKLAMVCLIKKKKSVKTDWKNKTAFNSVTPRLCVFCVCFFCMKKKIIIMEYVAFSGPFIYLFIY